MSGQPAYGTLSPELAERVRMVLEFHRWGARPEGVTSGGTFYETAHARLRRESIEMEALLAEIGRHWAGKLPGPVETLVSAGRMYRRAADFVKAEEYFLRALELVYDSGERHGESA
ncbi:tetratricopeptide repeat-containing protein [bacterium]|nr:tetratricopeptide repeat-containing protein [bacterium]